VRATQLIGFLESLGFSHVRQKGSHSFFRHLEGRTATVPDPRGEDLGRRILAKILRDAGTNFDQFSHLACSMKQTITESREPQSDQSIPRGEPGETGRNAEA
jgi:predicted RNA binding protein YcfA (HicA-like mRNA interferase family)